MAARKIPLPRDTLSLSAAFADQLLRRGNGDAALLYLYLLRHQGYYDPDEACRTMKWTREQLDGAMVHLGELGVHTGEPESVFDTQPPKKEEAPEYSNEDVSSALMDTASGFPALLGEVQRQLDKQLSPRDTRTLLELYDHLGMPAEVLVLLVGWQCQEYRDKYGEGRKPPMSYIRSAAYNWKKSGIDTLEAADAYLQKLDYYRSREGALLNAVSIRGRKATPTERKYLNQWAQWGFAPEAVSVAYDRTVTNTGEMKWSYCNAILKRWHSEGRHTLEEVQAASAPTGHRGHSRTALRPESPVTPKEAEEQARRIQENQAWMREFLAQPGWQSEEENPAKSSPATPSQKE